MFNLLPTVEKKKLHIEYYVRLATVAVGMVAVIMVVSGVFLIPLYVSARYEKENALMVLASNVDVAAADREERNAGTLLAEANKHVLALLPSSASAESRSVPSDLFSKILTFKTPAIKITSFAYSGSLDQEQVIVGGISQDRESMAVFADGLKKSGVFTAVELPVRSYVKSTNIDFSMTLTRTLKKTSQKTNAINK